MWILLLHASLIATQPANPAIVDCTCPPAEITTFLKAFPILIDYRYYYGMLFNLRGIEYHCFSVEKAFIVI